MKIVQAVAWQMLEPRANYVLAAGMGIRVIVSDVLLVGIILRREQRAARTVQLGNLVVKWVAPIVRFVHRDVIHRKWLRLNVSYVLQGMRNHHWVLSIVSNVFPGRTGLKVPRRKDVCYAQWGIINIRILPHIVSRVKVEKHRPLGLLQNRSVFSAISGSMFWRAAIAKIVRPDTIKM